MRAGDPRLWIWAEALQLLRGAEQRQRQFFSVVSSHLLPCWEPLVDAYQQGDELKLVVALPGVSDPRSRSSCPSSWGTFGRMT